MDSLESRLKQLYDDLAPYERLKVGSEVSKVYNDLFNEVMKDRPRPIGGVSKIDSETSGHTARLLAGQLQLLVTA